MMIMAVFPYTFVDSASAYRARQLHSFTVGSNPPPSLGRAAKRDDRVIVEKHIAIGLAPNGGLMVFLWRDRHDLPYHGVSQLLDILEAGSEYERVLCLLSETQRGYFTHDQTGPSWQLTLRYTNLVWNYCLRCSFSANLLCLSTVKM